MYIINHQLEPSPSVNALIVHNSVLQSARIYFTFLRLRSGPVRYTTLLRKARRLEDSVHVCFLSQQRS